MEDTLSPCSHQLMVLEIVLVLFHLGACDCGRVLKENSHLKDGVSFLRVSVFLSSVVSLHLRERERERRSLHKIFYFL